MNDAQQSAILDMVKVDLGISSPAYNQRLAQYIAAAAQAIEEEGAALDLERPASLQLVAMYVEYLWRRRDTGDGMPRMLRYALNNAIFKTALAKQTAEAVADFSEEAGGADG